MLMSKIAERKVNDYQAELKAERKQLEYEQTISDIRHSTIMSGVFKMSLSALGK